MRQTSDVVEIMQHRFEDDEEMQNMIAEEHIKSLAAMAIYEARTAAGMTQKQLAEKIGTQQPVIARLEDAHYEGHTISMLQRIAAAFDKRVEIRFADYGSACEEDAPAEEREAKAA